MNIVLQALLGQFHANQAKLVQFRISVMRMRQGLLIVLLAITAMVVLILQHQLMVTAVQCVQSVTIAQLVQLPHTHVNQVLIMQVKA